MFLKKLEIEKFRNIQNHVFEFEKNINIFIGNNAQGKTNVLESIYFLSITKSHRTNNELNLIKNNELYLKVSGIYNDNNDSNSLSITFNSKGKKVLVNNVIQKKISNYLSRLNVIMFCPDDLEIIKGSPSVRRKFLNIELSQFRNDYIFLLKDYNLALKQRNEYLKQKNISSFNNTYFGILTDKLIDLNIKIAIIRYDFIKKLNEYLKDIFKSIAENGNLIIKYKSFIKESDLNNNDIKKLLKNKYNEILNNEMLQKTTLLGIHKDDFKLYLDDLAVDEFCSQGQQRMSILSLKLAEIKVFINEKGKKPIILLDDIFSELDENKKNNIIKFFNDDMQIFITTTDINDINNELKEKSVIYKVNNGTFEREV